MEVSDAPDRVHLQIVFGGKKKTKESIRVVGKSRGHEKCVFEKEGFVFKRARRTPLRPAAAPRQPSEGAQQLQKSPAPAKPEQTAIQAGGLEQLPPDAGAPADQAGPGEAAAASQEQQEQQQQQGGDEREQQKPQQQRPCTEPAPLGPLHITMAASELAYLVQWVLTTELRLGGGKGSGGAEAAAQAEQIAQTTADRVKAALVERSRNTAAAGEAGSSEGAGEGATEPATVVLAPAVVLPFQVERLKAGLAEKRDWLLRVEKAWDDVEARYSDMAPGVQALAHGEEGQPAQAAAAEQPAEIAVDDSAGKNAGGSGSGDAEGEQAAGAEVESAEDAEGACEGPATAARSAAMLRLALQAEEMEALVAKVEMVAAEAEAVATALQAQFHKDRFNMYPHVNSPAMLIKSLIRGKPSDARGDAGSGDEDA